jgi:excisionase family DNA binding protein
MSDCRKPGRRTAASDSDRRLLRLKPAAAYLSIGPNTLRGIIQRGELPITKLVESPGAPWLVDRRDLDSFIEKCKVTLS